MLRRALLVTLVALAGCQKLADVVAAKPQTLKSADGSLEISVPGTWKVDKLNEQAVLQASDRASELYVIVLTEAKEDLAEMTLERFSEITRGSQLKAMKNGAEDGPTKRTINGMPAIEYVLRGSVNNANVVMKHVAIEGNKRYHQLLVWTLKSKWEAEKASLDKVVASLKENGSGANGARAPAP